MGSERDRKTKNPPRMTAAGYLSGFSLRGCFPIALHLGRCLAREGNAGYQPTSPLKSLDLGDRDPAIYP